MRRKSLTIGKHYKIRGAVFKTVERDSHFDEMGYFIQIVQGRIEKFNAGEIAHASDKWLGRRIIRPLKSIKA